MNNKPRVVNLLKQVHLSLLFLMVAIVWVDAQPTIPHAYCKLKIAFAAEPPPDAVSCDPISLCGHFEDEPLTMTITDGFSSSFGNGLTEEVIQVNGVFTINNQFKLKDCILKMAPGSSINVTSTDLFEIDNSRLFCCDLMWQGINVIAEGKIRIWKGTAIEDAIMAVEVDDPKYCVIHNSFFNKDFACIKIKNNEGFCDFGIAGNEFNCRPSLNEPISVPGSSVAGGAKHGIIVENSENVTIGLNGYPLNIFYHEGVDIKATNAQVCIKQSKFESGGWWGINNEDSGTCIYAVENSDICVHGLGSEPGDEVTFEGSAFIANIYGNNSTIRCYNSTFLRTKRHAILIENTGDHYFRIENNWFQWWNPLGTRHAIKATRGTISNDWIRYNYFNYDFPLVTTNGGGSIINVTSNTNSSNLLDISQNEIWSNESNAIELVAGNTQRNFIQGNQLFSNDNAATGILFNSGIGGTSPYDRNRIKGNTIDDGNYTVQTGIQINASQRADVCGNVLLNSGVGISLSGNCMNTIVGGNQFTNNSVGLQLLGNGINLGDNTNTHRVNKWSGTFGLFAAQHTGTDAGFSPFPVNDDDQNCGNADYFPNSNGSPSVSPNSGWFSLGDECPNWCGILAFAGGGGNNSGGLNGNIIDGTFGNSGQSDASIWDTEYTLYREMLNDNEAVSSAFVTSYKDKAYPRLNNVENTITAAYALSTETRTELLALYPLVSSLMEESSELQDKFAQNPNDSELEAQLISVADQLNEANNEVALWRAIAKDERITKLEEAKLSNASINPENIFEIHMKRVNEIRLHYLEGHLFDDKMLADLEELAGKCYEEAGPAIFFAYALLPDCRKPDVFPAICDYLKPSKNTGSIKKHNALAGLRLYPNPASRQLEVLNLEQISGTLEAEIYNTLGQKLLHKKLQVGESIDINALSAGTFYCRIYNEHGTIKTIPFVKTAD